MIIALFSYDYIKYKVFGVFYIGPLNWLYSSNGRFWLPNLQDLEKSVDDKSLVILITDNMHLDANNQPTIETVSNNLNRGVEYIFITSYAPENNGNIQRCKQLYARQDNVSINLMPSQTIRRRTLDNILIITDPKNGVSAYLQIPVGAEEWWAKLDDEHTTQVLENVHTYIRSDDLKNIYGFDPVDRYKAAFAPVSK